MDSLLLLLTLTLIRLSSSLSYGCFMDGCNPQRTFTMGAAYVPYKTKQSLKINWTFSANNYTQYTVPSNSTISVNNSINDNSLKYGQYLGCTTNVETGLSNAISCLFNNRGLFSINEFGDYLWSYVTPNIISQLSNISSVPLLLPYNTTIINDGLSIIAFSNGVFLWSETTANLSIPFNTLSSYSIGFVNPQYFSVKLGDDRFALYDYSLGMCWTAIYLMYEEEQYKPIAVSSSINTFIYVLGLNNVNNRTVHRDKCAIFAFQIGDTTYRLQTRWVFPMACNEDIGYLGISVIKYLNSMNQSDPFPAATLISYGLENDSVVLYGINDKSQYRANLLWKIELNEYCPMGYLIDSREDQYGLSGVWIGDYYENNTFLLQQINITNGVIITTMNVNDMLFSTFSTSNDWKSVESVNITSRGVTGFTSDIKHYVIVVCVDVFYLNENNVISESNILISIDIEDEYILSWYIFDDNTKCVGQISATTNDLLVVPLNDGMTVTTLGV